MIFLFLVFCESIGFEVPATEHVPRVLPKDEDLSLVKRNTCQVKLIFLLKIQVS